MAKHQFYYIFKNSKLIEKKQVTVHAGYILQDKKEILENLISLLNFVPCNSIFFSLSNSKLNTPYSQPCPIPPLNRPIKASCARESQGDPKVTTRLSSLVARADSARARRDAALYKRPVRAYIEKLRGALYTLYITHSNTCCMYIYTHSARACTRSCLYRPRMSAAEKKEKEEEIASPPIFNNYAWPRVFDLLLGFSSLERGRE